MLVAALGEGVGLLVSVVIAFVNKNVSGPLTWVAPQAVGVGGAMLKAGIDWAAEGKGDDKDHDDGPPQQYGRYGSSGQYVAPRYGAASTRGSRGTPVLVSILVALLVCGGGGLAIATGARYAFGYVTGKETGIDRLLRPVSAQSGELTLTVEHVVYTAHFTRVEVAVQNSGNSSISLPVYGYCTLIGNDGTVLQADPFRSQWSDTVPPGVQQRGTVTFPGQLPDGVTGARFSFSQIFVLGGGSITVSGLALGGAP
jgi:hypothetical protein